MGGSLHACCLTGVCRQSLSCDTAARVMPLGDGQGVGAAPWWKHLQRQNPAGKGGVKGAVHPTGASSLLSLPVPSLLTGLPQMQQENCRRSEVRAIVAGLALCSCPLGSACPWCATIQGPLRSWGSLSLSAKVSGSALGAGTSDHSHAS